MGSFTCLVVHSKESRYSQGRQAIGERRVQLPGGGRKRTLWWQHVER